jgi:hypothetical protein
VDLEGGFVVYPSNPPAAAGSQPPTTVKISTYLLWLVAAVSLITAIIEISVVGRTTDVYRELNAGTPAEGTEAAIVAIGIVAVVISLLFAAGLAVLAIFNNRGRNGARITTWVIGGIALCCSGLGLAGTALTGSMNLGDTTGGPTPAEVERRLDEVLPSWYDPATVTLTVISLLALLGAMILLALPASNAYFRKPAAAGWDPSLPYPYPGGQPSYPGGQPPYPAAGQQSPYPPYPGQGQQPPYSSYPGQAPDPSTPPPPSGPSQSGPPPSGPPQSGPGPAGSTAAEPPGQSPPHTGSIPPTDPWGRPDDDRRPPSGPAT